MAVDLRTTYLGFELPHPFMPGASPLADDLDSVRRLEDAHAAAIVLRSLFEEQLEVEARALLEHAESHEESCAEARSYLPGRMAFVFGPDEYLEQVRRVKDAVRVPVIGSLNGTTLGGWLEFAKLIQQAGADALELNIYDVAADPRRTSGEIETEVVAMLQELRREMRIPIAVKLSPFYTSLPHLAARLEGAGANGLVLFNRLYQPDIDPEALEIRRRLRLSDTRELPLRLLWLGVLSAQRQLDLAVSGGVHTAVDAVKAVMAGAHAVQLVSCLLRRGPRYLATLQRELAQWLEEHGYDSLARMRGSMNLGRCPDPRAFERANYMEVLQSWEKPPGPGAA